MPHNHPPLCCCQPHPDDIRPYDGKPYESGQSHPLTRCPSCTEHGDLAECVSCHQLGDQPHTEYCQRENRDYPGQPGVRPDGRNLTTYDPTSNPPHVSRAMLEDHQPSAIAVVTNDLEQSTKAAHGVSHQPGPWCPNPCAYHGSPDR